jgi:hypothetical protein
MAVERTASDSILVPVPDLHLRRRMRPLVSLAVRPGVHQHRSQFRRHCRNISKHQASIRPVKYIPIASGAQKMALTALSRHLR